MHRFPTLKHIPVGSLLYQTRSRLVKSKLSVRSVSHWRCDSALMAAYSCTKACGFADAWSKLSNFRHCHYGMSLYRCSAITSTTPRTPSRNKKLMMLAGLTLLIILLCSLVNIIFSTSFDSKQLIIQQEKTVKRVQNLRQAPS